MNLPFTTEEFMNVFKTYNQAVFPLQILFNILALAVIFFSIKKTRLSNKINSSILAFLWMWIGIVYQIIFFSKINPAANIFGALFILQGLLFLYFGVFREKLNFNFRKNISGSFGLIFILYALVVYPILGIIYGHTYPGNPTFGLPCPTTIFTFGIFLWIDNKVPLYLWTIPFIWSLIGFSAALNLGIKEDTGLILAGVFGTVLIIINNYILRKGRKKIIVKPLH